MFVRTPFTHRIHSPSFYWVVQPGTEEEEKAVAASNTGKEQSDGSKSSDMLSAPKPSSPKTFRHLFVDDFELVEEDDNVVLSTELPGIKHADLKVEFRDSALHVAGSRKKGTKKQSFLRRVALDEDAIDVDNLTATLEDGILTVKAPKAKKPEDKKEEETHKVVVTKSSPPEESTELNMEIDVPGIKVEDLDIVLSKSGVLSVSGERKNGRKRCEAYMLNTRKVDTHKLEAYLADGVLTIRAPAKVHKVKTVAVNGKLPPVAEKKLDEEKTGEDPKMEE